MQFKMIKAYLPVFIFFSILFPLGFIFSFGTIIQRTLSTYLISGSITFFISINSIISVAQNLALERSSGRFSLMIASGIPIQLYAISITISNGIQTLMLIPVFLVLGYFLLGVRISSALFFVLSIIGSIYMASMVGLLIGTAIRNLHAVNQWSSIIGFILSFFAPVYFPLTQIPLPFRYLAYLEPTTYVSQSTYFALVGNPISLAWFGGTVVIGFLFSFLSSLLMKKASLRKRVKVYC